MKGRRTVHRAVLLLTTIHLYYHVIRSAARGVLRIVRLKLVIVLTWHLATVKSDRSAVFTLRSRFTVFIKLRPYGVDYAVFPHSVGSTP